MIDADPSYHSWKRPLHAQTAANQKAFAAPGANGKMTLMPTMVFLEFPLSGFKNCQ
jgi:hypothetical protein